MSSRRPWHTWGTQTHGHRKLVRQGSWLELRSSGHRKPPDRCSACWENPGANRSKSTNKASCSRVAQALTTQCSPCRPPSTWCLCKYCSGARERCSVPLLNGMAHNKTFCTIPGAMAASCALVRAARARGTSQDGSSLPGTPIRECPSMLRPLNTRSARAHPACLTGTLDGL